MQTEIACITKNMWQGNGWRILVLLVLLLVLLLLRHLIKWSACTITIQWNKYQYHILQIQDNRPLTKINFCKVQIVPIITAFWRFPNSLEENSGIFQASGTTTVQPSTTGGYDNYIGRKMFQRFCISFGHTPALDCHLNAIII